MTHFLDTVFKSLCFHLSTLTRDRVFQNNAFSDVSIFIVFGRFTRRVDERQKRIKKHAFSDEDVFMWSWPYNC